MDDNEIHEIEEQLEPDPQTGDHGPEREGIPWSLVLLVIWAVLLVIFSVQNAEDATVEFLVWDWQMPVALVVMITALVTLVLTGVGSIFYRRRRRKIRQMKKALGSDDYD